MDQNNKFRVVAWWSSGRTGIAKSDSAPNAIHFAAPVAFGGLEGRWTPEDMLMGAVASCFTTTFRALADRSAFEYTDLQMDVEGTVSRDGPAYAFTAIMIRANLTVPREEAAERGLRLLHKTKAVCLVSRALAVEQTFEPVVTVGVPAARASEQGELAVKK
ncbi:MAG TPA: OsmC family protein [Terriglobales bacterium]|nr:OsmC family protein [Terriglobales bacterium]